VVRMTDIAIEAGVSRSTVSLVLNNKHTAVGIPESTRRRVLHAARQLGYRPNELARAMVTGKNRVIVYLLHDPSQEVASRILKGALEEAELHGYLVKLVGREGAFDERDIERCVELRPVGVMALYVTPAITDYLQQEMARYRIPVVLLDSSFPLQGVTRVLSDDIEGIWQGISHLYSLGHRRIAYISGASFSGASALREEGYRRAMARLELPVPEGFVACGEWLIPNTQEATRQLLQHPDGQRPTALFCADDKMALTAVRTAERMGIRVPQDLSIVGFADLEMALYGNPPLTTVAQPFTELGVAAVRSILAAAERWERQEEPETGEVLLPNRLVIRESTAPAPQSFFYY
jgi:DNA-binding LacI/PurR family transcriptional regulator